MSQLHPRVFTAERNGHCAVVTCVSGDLHEIGVRMVSDFLEMEGWDTFYLGANTPTPAILKALEDRCADVLAVSATITSHVRAVADLIAAVRSSPVGERVRILVGGYPFNVEPDLWRQIGADAVAGDAQDAVLAAGELVGAVRPPGRLSLTEELVRITNEQSNAVRAAMKDLALQARERAERDSRHYDELSCSVRSDAPASGRPTAARAPAWGSRSSRRSWKGLPDDQGRSGAGAHLRGGDLRRADLRRRPGGVGRGSTFTVTLPLIAPDSDRGQLETPVTFAPEELTAVVGPGLEDLQRAPAHNGDRPLVLVIEDDPDASALLTETLETAGYQVRVAGSGPRGLELARELNPSAITLDIMMPGMDGWRVLQSLKSEPRTAEIPVIVCSISNWTATTSWRPPRRRTAWRMRDPRPPTWS